MIISIILILSIFSIAIGIAWLWYIKSEKANYELLFKEGLKEFKKNNYHSAEAAFEKAISLDPKFKEAIYQLGLVYLKLEDFAKASENFEKMLKLAPKDFNGLYNMGLALQNQGLYDEAKECFIKALQEDPNNKDCNFNLGVVNFKQGDFSSATEFFEKVKEVDPEMAEASFYLVKCKDELIDSPIGKEQETQTVIDEYLTFEKEHPEELPKDFHLSLAKAYAKKGQLKESFERCEKSLELNSDDPDTYNYLGLIQLIKKDLAGAKNSLSTALSLEPNNKEAHVLLSYVLCQQEDKCAMKKCRDKYQDLIKKLLK